MPRFVDRVLMETWLVVPLVRLAIAVLPFGLVHRAVERAAGRRRSASDVSQERIASAVARVSHHIPGANCLTQVIAAALLSARHGHAATFRLGVAKSEGRLAAHAWLENEGRVVIGEPEPGLFVALGR